MDKLPVEILSKIIDNLSIRDQVRLQLVSKEFLILARDSSRWRLHCYDRPWSEPESVSRGISEGSALGPIIPPSSPDERSFLSFIRPRDTRPADSSVQNENGMPSSRKRLKTAARWDPSSENENVDWYSEYIGRHGPISLSWLQQPFTRATKGPRGPSHEAKGLGFLKNLSFAGQDRVIAPLEDGCICVWDLSHSTNPITTTGAVLGISPPGILTTDYSRGRNSHTLRSALEFMNNGECVSVDSTRKRVYLAVGDALNEVDLETLKVVSQQRYQRTIFALSQETDYSVPLTLATVTSLHLYDCRLPFWKEGEAVSDCYKNVAATSLANLSFYYRSSLNTLRLHANDWIRGTGGPDPLDEAVNYTPLLQPGPLAVLHPPVPHVNTILLAGRFPSVLSYDRRILPRLQSSAHSGGRLCGLASIPDPRSSALSDIAGEDVHKIVACGEYNGRGSLELYGLALSNNAPDAAPVQLTDKLYTVNRNRQSVARSKLLSVASHGTRIVYSDAEGNIKWVERDGCVEIRHWNINLNHRHSNTSAAKNRAGLWPSKSEDGSEVARKVLPTGGHLVEDELLVWTGDRIGRIRFSSSDKVDEDEEESEDMTTQEESNSSLREEIRAKRHSRQRQENEYVGMMRKALETQADEVRWMGRLGLT